MAQAPATSTAKKANARSFWRRLPIIAAPYTLPAVTAFAAIIVRPGLQLTAANAEVFDAGAFALALVALFRFAEGRVRFDALGMRITGAAGALVAWILCFAAILVALRV